MDTINIGDKDQKLREISYKLRSKLKRKGLTNEQLGDIEIAFMEVNNLLDDLRAEKKQIHDKVTWLFNNL